LVMACLVAIATMQSGGDQARSGAVPAPDVRDRQLFDGIATFDDLSVDSEHPYALRAVSGTLDAVLELEGEHELPADGLHRDRVERAHVLCEAGF